MGIKYFANEHFFSEWNPTMAYVLGYWYADGSLENAMGIRGKYIRVTSTDQETIVKIKKWLGSQHSIVPLLPTSKRPGKTRYFFRIGSHSLYNDLVSLGLYPNKSLTVKFPQVPDIFLNHFLRGNFDGDGCAFLETGKGVNGNLIVKRQSAIFTSGSFEFLSGIVTILKERLSLSQSNIYKGSGAYQLRYSTKDALKLFEFFYDDCPVDAFLIRKFDVFCSYYRLRPEMASPKVLAILDRLSVNGLVAK